MGWLRRILKIEDSEESADEELQEASIDIDMLPEWIDRKSNEGFEKVKPGISEQFSRLFDEKKNLSANLEALRDAELHNPNISEREKQLMEGNRSAYISQHKQFINFLNISEDLTCRETAQFCRNFEELISKLAKSTAKGHAVMKEFFADHASRINKTVKLMSDSVSRVQEILEDGNVGVEMIGDVQKSVAELRSKRKLLAELDEELAVLKKKLANSNFLKDKLLKGKEELKQSEGYSEFKTANDEREELWKRLKQAEVELSSLFSPLQRAMRKFERMLAEGSDLFNDYMDSPLSAIAKDEHLRILDMLARMRSALEEGSLELKDSDKAVQRAGDVTRERLSQLRDVCVSSKSSIKRIDDQMRNSRVLGELNDLQYKVEHTESQIKIIEDKIDKAQKTREKIDLVSLKVSVEEKIREAFGVEVTVTWQESGHSSTA
ncbi:hypothetical protein JW898_03505 [Candidatus Woesearchaeota archaeon]|nr:hypothetical protein [Candidatus Woesearchaeota archaeon]